MTTAAAAILAAPARAQGLASPGPLSSAHARVDAITRCLACHEAGRELSGRRCLACHTSLAARIEANQGYHSVATHRGSALSCGTCHSEHNGRPFRLVRWQPGGTREQFDHRDAGWPLEGAHARQRCESCHRAATISVAAVRADSSLSVQRTYLGLGTTCVSCHLDEHRGRTSRQCEDCHGVEEWKPAPRFDHARTRFALSGRHRDARCDQCHETIHDPATGPGGSRDTSFVDFRGGRPGRPAQTRPQAGATAGCAGCHASPHRDASRMSRCESCHTAEGWFSLPDSVRRFDHSAIGFPLRGAHATARCESCHLSSPDAALPRGTALLRANFVRPFAHQRMAVARCDICHADPHRGELAPRAAGRDCGDCHDETRFTPTRFGPVMHDSTAFPLTGAHAATPCTACHSALPGAATGSGRVSFRHPDQSCGACHRDPHGGQFAGRQVPGARPLAGPEGGAIAGTRCEACHETEAWDRTAFDHDQTRYPIRGAHSALACARCHTRPESAPRAPVRFRDLPVACSACHNDPHGGQFVSRSRGGTCETCHTEAAWRQVTFDHQRDSDFLLDGAHRAVACGACHRSEGLPPVVRYIPLPQRCEDCHRSAPPGGRS